MFHCHVSFFLGSRYIVFFVNLNSIYADELGFIPLDLDLMYQHLPPKNPSPYFKESLLAF